MTSVTFGPEASFPEESHYVEKVVKIRRVSKVVAGGRRFTFNALVVAGDQNGRVGIGYGRGREVPEAVQKGTSIAQGNMVAIRRSKKTVPHLMVANYGAARVLVKPAAPGTGVIAGSAVRAVLEAAGIEDALTKSLGSSNPINVVKATFKALQMMRDPKEESANRKELARLARVGVSGGAT